MSSSTGAAPRTSAAAPTARCTPATRSHRSCSAASILPAEPGQWAIRDVAALIVGHFGAGPADPPRTRRYSRRVRSSGLPAAVLSDSRPPRPRPRRARASHAPLLATSSSRIDRRDDGRGREDHGRGEHPSHGLGKPGPGRRLRHPPGRTQAVGEPGPGDRAVAAQDARRTGEIPRLLRRRVSEGPAALAGELLLQGRRQRDRTGDRRRRVREGARTVDGISGRLVDGARLSGSVR